MTTPPAISVAIPTCNRPDDVERCLDSLTQVTYPHWDILLIDQSDDRRTAALAGYYAHHLPQLMYQHMNEKGLSRARNVAMRSVPGDIVAFLDDDCTVEASWLLQIAAAFERHPDAGMIFGTVNAAPHDWRRSFIPCFEVQEERRLRGPLAFLKVGGMGASMYIPRALYRHIGPWDVYAGTGGAFASHEDRDYSYRILASGRTVVETPAVVVTHHGARDFASGAASRLCRAGAYAQGAVDMKLARCGDTAALLFVAKHLVDQIIRINPRRLIMRQRATGLAWISMYVLGLLAGIRVPVNREQRLWGCLSDYDARDLPEATVR